MLSCVIPFIASESFVLYDSICIMGKLFHRAGEKYIFLIKSNPFDRRTVGVPGWMVYFGYDIVLFFMLYLYMNSILSYISFNYKNCRLF